MPVGLANQVATRGGSRCTPKRSEYRPAVPPSAAAAAASWALWREAETAAALSGSSAADPSSKYQSSYAGRPPPAQDAPARETQRDPRKPGDGAPASAAWK